MGLNPSVVTLDLHPRTRVDLISVKEHLSREFRSVLSRYRKTVYYSYHTTAGYLDPNLCARLNHSSDSLHAFVKSYQKFFPPGANYQHDQLHLRKELSEEERKGEPRNGDAHLTYIGSGLANCVTYSNDPRVPVFFIDLDGVNGGKARCRKTTVIGFNQEYAGGCLDMAVPMSVHSIDSVNLKDKRIGLFEELHHELRKRDITKGRIDLTLDTVEVDAGLTVNEFETLLMKHDLVDVLSNPFLFMAEKGRHILSDPLAIPSKAKGYAKYDLVQILNKCLDAAQLRGSFLERLIYKFMALPASHFLRMKRSISLLVLADEAGRGRIVQGKYQTPILVQWGRARGQARSLNAAFFRFD